MFQAAAVVHRGVENAVAAGNGSSEGIKSRDGRRMSISTLQETSAKKQKLDVAIDASRTRRPGAHPPESCPESGASVKSEGEVPKGLEHTSKKIETLEIEEVVPRSEDAVVTDLALVIHGIGQDYTAQHEAWGFTYTTNLLREMAFSRLSCVPVDPSLYAYLGGRIGILRLTTRWRIWTT
ncbi:hypothetical protein FRC08_010111 [Ceratobasidium sp. 394]|nr:hypothetical protein FRC08_010111 [Ceratobasidium sp. 394]